MKSADVAVVAKAIELVAKNPPKDELWDTAQRHGPNLETRLRNWLKEQL